MLSTLCIFDICLYLAFPFLFDTAAWNACMPAAELSSIQNAMMNYMFSNNCRAMFAAISSRDHGKAWLWQPAGFDVGIFFMILQMLESKDLA